MKETDDLLGAAHGMALHQASGTSEKQSEMYYVTCSKIFSTVSNDIDYDSAYIFSAVLSMK